MEEKKISIAGRIGYFFLALLPAIAMVALQVVIQIVMMVVVLFTKFRGIAFSVKNLEDTMELMYKVYRECGPSMVFVTHLLTIILFGIWYKFSFKKPRPKVLGTVKKLPPRAFVVAIVCGVAVWTITEGIAAIEAFLMPKQMELFNEMADLSGFGNSILGGIAAVGFAPIGEEIVCRGLTLKFAKKSFGKFWIANIFQALVFGVLHMNWIQGIYAFIIGLVLGWFVKETNSIIPGMLVHFVVNFSSVSWGPYVLQALPETMAICIMMAVIPWAAVVVLMMWLRGAKKQETEATEEYKSEEAI